MDESGGKEFASTANGQEGERSQELIRLKGLVQGLTAEHMRDPEGKGSHIRETVHSGLDLIADDVSAEAAETNQPLREVALTKCWPMDDFARSFLTHPLPPQAFEYEGDQQIPLETEVADETNWWNELTQMQKGVLSEYVGIDLLQADTFSPSPGEEEQTHIIQEAPTPLPDTNIYPVLVWNPHSVCLTAYHKEA